MITLSQLFTLDGLSVPDIHALFRRAKGFKESGVLELVPEVTLGLIFWEPSTRTRVSFEMAAQQLGARTVLLERGNSSSTKGESLEDTLLNLRAMGVRHFVIRSPENAWYSKLPRSLLNEVAIINGGDGSGEHPTQALLDAFTLEEYYGYLEKLRVGIFGDILHSRVARSNHTLMKKLGAECILSGPPSLMDENAQNHKLDDLIPTLDALMLLRIQKERFSGIHAEDFTHYLKDYGLTPQRLDKMKPRAVFMHPGPINWGTEIDESLKNSIRSLVLKQVENGKYIRMAVLDACFKRFA